MEALVRYAVIVAIAVAIIGGWYGKQQYDAVQRGREIERAKVAAQSNQNIAERRKTDATFDKMDARALCIDAGLEWVFDDGKSLCR
jgi:hypothetical protein